MKLLLDTRILLWALLDDPRLPSTARRLIEDRENKVHFSIVSPWEVQIKHQIHPDKLTLDGKALAKYCGDAGYLPMPVKLAHVFALGALKRKEGAPPHKDPFDRMLVCQASAEGMLLVTHDSRLSEYDDSCVLAV